jgi:hypothetical protein
VLENELLMKSIGTLGRGRIRLGLRLDGGEPFIASVLERGVNLGS